MSSLGAFVAALQSRGPLDRSYPEMETLLRGVDGWPVNRPLAHRPGGYTRTLLYGDDAFEVLLLNWDLNARSALHDHGCQHCWMAVLAGHLQVDDYARIDDGEVWLVGCDIPEYAMGNRLNHKPKRSRKLLMHRREIHKFAGRTEGKGLTVIPLRLYFRDGIAKVEIALAQGKKSWDRRQDERTKEARREAEQALYRNRRR